MRKSILTTLSALLMFCMLMAWHGKPTFINCLQCTLAPLGQGDLLTLTNIPWFVFWYVRMTVSVFMPVEGKGDSILKGIKRKEGQNNCSQTKNK
jgi:hypothetical protein